MFAGPAPGDQNVLAAAGVTAGGRRGIGIWIAAERGQRIDRPAGIRVLLILPHNVQGGLILDFCQHRYRRAVFRLFQRFAHLEPQQLGGFARPFRREQRLCSGKAMKRIIGRDGGEQKRRHVAPGRRSLQQLVVQAIHALRFVGGLREHIFV